MTQPLSGLDEKLKDWAFPKEAEYLDAINRYGGGPGRRAAAKGYSPDHDMRHPVPEGFTVKGVSTYYDKDGIARGQWVKSKATAEADQEAVREFVAWLVAGDRYPPSPAPKRCLSALLAVYLFGDPHFGMRSSVAEGGDDFDLDAADRLTRRGIDRLADATPDSEEALLIVIGDNPPANDSSHKTPAHGNALDMDAGGHNRSMLVSAKAWAYACKRLLDKHLTVKVWFLPGNHDPDAAFSMALALSLYFESEPRISVDLSQGLYRYLRFGKVMIGAHHGHGAKPADLPLLMAV